MRKPTTDGGDNPPATEPKVPPVDKADPEAVIDDYIEQVARLIRRRNPPKVPDSGEMGEP